MGRLYFLFFLLSSSIVLAQTQDSLVLQPGPLDGKDAIVWSITPDSTWGWNQEATMTAWTYQGDPSYKRFYIEFDYSNIPAGAIIDSAFIFYNNNPSAPSHSGLHSGSNTFWVRRVTSSWDEDSITWNNAQSDTTLNEVQVGASTSNTMDYKIDVKNLVEDQLQHGNHGFFMRLVTEATWRAVVCASSNAADSTNHPAIKIYYTECNPPAASYTHSVDSNQVWTFVPQDTTGSSYWWDFGDGTFSNNMIGVHSYSVAGLYPVCLSITNACGVDTTCLIFEVTMVGLYEHWNPDLSVYPNPVQSILRIKNAGTDPLLHCEIYDMRGVLVQFGAHPTSQINLEKLSSGTYLLKIIQRNRTSMVRIVKS